MPNDIRDSNTHRILLSLSSCRLRAILRLIIWLLMTNVLIVIPAAGFRIKRTVFVKHLSFKVLTKQTKIHQNLSHKEWKGTSSGESTYRHLRRCASNLFKPDYTFFRYRMPFFLLYETIRKPYNHTKCNQKITHSQTPSSYLTSILKLIN